MQASDVMTCDVVSVSPDTPIRSVARALLTHGISAAPVLDTDGAAIGMVSEGDLVRRDEGARLERRDWWLRLIAGDTPKEADFLTQLGVSPRTAGDVMATPVITVSEHTPLTEIAQLLNKHRIKRVPVVKDGSVVGIVSRADLLRAMAIVEPAEGLPSQAPAKGHLLADILSMFMGSHPVPHETAPLSGGPAPVAPSLTADTLRHLVADFHRDEVKHRDAERRAAARQRQVLAEQLIDTHVTDAVWQALLHRARKAASSGQTEIQLLRFPNTLCSDEGRAINVGFHDWPSTLRGEPAELYLRYARDLKGRGFHMSAHVLEFPGGKPGDIGLFLVWGEKE